MSLHRPEAGGAAAGPQTMRNVSWEKRAKMVVVLVEIRDLVLDVPRLRVHPDLHMRKGQVRVLADISALEDLVEVGCC